VADVKKGDCFEAAFGLQLENKDLVLCHGIVVGQERIEGKRHWHAWCEYEEEIDLGPARAALLEATVPDSLKHLAARAQELRNPRLPMVRDHSNGKAVELPAALYYSAGRIDPAEVWRYTRLEALNQAMTHRHYGPWVEVEP